MNTFRFFLRLFTLGCYFLPFVFYMSTCVGDEFRSAYNKKDAFKNIAEARTIQMNLLSAEIEELKLSITEENRAAKIDSMHGLIQRRLDPFDSAERVNLMKDSLDGKFRQRLMLSMVYPTNYSISAVAAMFDYKNISGQVMIIVSAVISVLLLLLWRWLKRWRVTFFLLALNLASVLLFMVDSFISRVDLLWGYWLLLLFIALQFVLEWNVRRHRQQENESSGNEL